jgi:hypothetical protein
MLGPQSEKYEDSGCLPHEALQAGVNQRTFRRNSATLFMLVSCRAWFLALKITGMRSTETSTHFLLSKRFYTSETKTPYELNYYYYYYYY